MKRSKSSGTSSWNRMLSSRRAAFDRLVAVAADAGALEFPHLDIDKDADDLLEDLLAGGGHRFSFGGSALNRVSRRQIMTR